MLLALTLVSLTASPAPRLLNPKICGWLPENRKALNAFIAARGKSSPRYAAKHPPVAAFDWDNTILKNDIGDAFVYWLLTHDKVLQPAAKDWSKVSSSLTDEALKALKAECDTLAEPGKPLATSRHEGCAGALLQIYEGDKRWWKFDHTLTMNNPMAWAAQLAAGYTPSEVRQFARAAYEQNRAAPVGTTQTIGAHQVTGWVRIYEPMKDLIETLTANGFDVWVVSASPQNVVEEVAKEVGVDASHVLGIRSLLDHGRLTASFEGCGPVGDGQNTLITFDQGKRCWLNRVVFKVPRRYALEKNPDLAQRQAFAAGDSDTDIAFMQDATELKLVLNRNKTQLMCNAYAAQTRAPSTSQWLIQPMFIGPNPQQAEAYPCSTARDSEGKPILNEYLEPMADQRDTVFALPLCP